MALSAQHQQKAAALGIDLSKIDWQNLIQNFAALVSILAQLFRQTPPVLGFDRQAARAQLKAAGCPDDQCDPCCHCLEAAFLAMQSAQLSLECAEHCATP
jgi:hypothetical protein